MIKMEFLSFILLTIGSLLLTLGILYLLSCKHLYSTKKGLYTSFSIVIIGGLLIFFGFKVEELDRQIQFNQMESRSLILKDVYVSKIKGNFADLAKDNYYKTFKMYPSIENFKIKSGDTIDIIFDPETNIVLKTTNIRESNIVQEDPFITKSLKNKN